MLGEVYFKVSVSEKAIDVKEFIPLDRAAVHNDNAAIGVQVFRADVDGPLNGLERGLRRKAVVFVVSFDDINVIGHVLEENAGDVRTCQVSNGQLVKTASSGIHLRDDVVLGIQ